ncbi:hypothetical protein L218DRAFT_1007783 [Marasmius fiardii PR-910]|nr:hypothetical protein L218DRAFT_1007783 [Marasmius fiardii PR-910]
MAQESAPKVGTDLALLNLFGLASVPARICAAIILTFIITFFFLRYQYPSLSPPSLMEVADRATVMFNECLAMGAFRAGEYDKFNTLLHQITSRASEVASRTHLDEHEVDGVRRSASTYIEYLNKALFFWKRLKDIIKCHQEAQLLIRDLQICLMRASHVRAECELYVQRPRRDVEGLRGFGETRDVVEEPHSWFVAE